MVSIKHIQVLKVFFISSLSFTLLLHTIMPYIRHTATLLRHVTAILPLWILSCAFCILLALFYYRITRPKRIFLLNYACYKPPPHRICSYKVAESFVLRNKQFSQESLEFLRNIYNKSGLGDKTYAPPFIFEDDDIPTLKCAIQEAQEGVFSSIDALLAKTLMSPSCIDIVIVTSGSFSPSPSLSSYIVNHYNLKPGVKTYNLSGMGCSSGVLSIDLAARILRSNTKCKNALVVITESITLNWYSGDNRPMLVTNCIFRVGCAAAIVTSDMCYSRVAKMELVHSLRTHHGADDSSYHAAFQEEDEKGFTGISLTKDLIRVAGVNLRQHITLLAPRVLPLSQLASHAYSVILTVLSKGKCKTVVPDFMTAFDHVCVHTGGKAVIDQVGRLLQLSNDVTEPARMSLHRFGNTSSSLVVYELAYFEAKRRVKKGDKMWMIAFGTGFKCGSLVWRWLNSTVDSDNPWIDCIDNYPLENW